MPKGEPKILGWYCVKGFETEWRCPKGCLNANGGPEPDTCDHGSIYCDETTLKFFCYHCDYEESYELQINLVPILEEDVDA